MSTSIIDRDTLKSVLSEILKENPDYIKMILKEIITEQYLISSEEESASSLSKEEMIQKDFDKYDEVFKALA